MTERQLMVLRLIVDNYVLSAEPVGSRTISKQADLGLSAATIRNVMADLEEMGYLEQPHASAGRIPSQLGYRFYVDHLLSQGSDLSAQEIGRVKSLFAERIGEMERVAQQTASFLSNLTQYTAVVLGPQVYDTTLKSLQLVPISDRTAVALVVTSNGQVHNKTVTVPDGLLIKDFEQMFKILDKKLVGIPLYRIRSKALEEITLELARHMNDFEEAIRVLDQVLAWMGEDSEGKLYVGGTTNMLLQPEFQNVQKAKSVLTWLEHHQNVMDVLRGDDATGERLQVRIGGENELLTLRDCSLVTATYHVGITAIGVVGILGPVRMDYARVIPLLDQISKDMTELFTKFYVS
nr:heat-inducible transcriptional repressor HrcA [Sulfoacidibacillus ferrooxidans]